MTTPAATPTPDFGPTVPRPKRVLWKWSLAFTAAALLFLLWQCGSSLYQGRSLANASVRHFHEQLNNGRYEDIYGEADEGFVRSGKREDLVKFLQAVHTKLGEASSESLTNINVNAATRGTFITTVYATQFTRGRAVETFTWIKRNGVLKLYGYNVQSNALILN